MVAMDFKFVKFFWTWKVVIISYIPYLLPSTEHITWQICTVRCSQLRTGQKIPNRFSINL